MISLPDAALDNAQCEGWSRAEPSRAHGRSSDGVRWWGAMAGRVSRARAHTRSALICSRSHRGGPLDVAWTLARVHFFDETGALFGGGRVTRLAKTQPARVQSAMMGAYACAPRTGNDCTWGCDGTVCFQARGRARYHVDEEQGARLKGSRVRCGGGEGGRVRLRRRRCVGERGRFRSCFIVYVALARHRFVVVVGIWCCLGW